MAKGQCEKIARNPCVVLVLAGVGGRIRKQARRRFDWETPRQLLLVVILGLDGGGGVDLVHEREQKVFHDRTGRNVGHHAAGQAI